MVALGYDWYAAYYPALVAFLAGANPYMGGRDPFLNPPWLLPVLAPLALLPQAWGAWAVILIAITGLGAACYRHKVPPWATALLAASLPMASLVYHANMEGLVLWGLALGGPAGLFLLSLKPQVAALVGAVWAYQAYRQGGVRPVVRLCAPTLLAAVVFTALYPQWVGEVIANRALPGVREFNLWPYLVPLGVYWLWAALRRARQGQSSVAEGALATVALAPYVRVQSLLGAVVLTTARRPWLALLWWAGPWLWFLAQGVFVTE